MALRFVVAADAHTLRNLEHSLPSLGALARPPWVHADSGSARAALLLEENPIWKSDRWPISVPPAEKSGFFR